MEFEASMEALEGAAAVLVHDSLTHLSDDEVVEFIRQLETTVRTLGAVSDRLIVEAMERSIPGRLGYNSPNKLLVDIIRVSATDASARVGRAREVGTWHTMDGQPAPPALPETAAARADGAIGNDHVRAVSKTLRKVPRVVSPSDIADAEKILADCARHGTPEDVEQAGHRLLAYLDPDGSLTDERDRARRRGLHVSRQDTDLMSKISGELDPTTRALLDPVLEKWARPGMNNPSDPDSPTGDSEDSGIDRDRLAAAAARDTRTTGQRNHDALTAMLRTVLSSGSLGSHRGLPATAIITMTLAQLEKSAGGVVTTASGGLVPIPEALKLAEQSHPILALFDHDGRPLHLGRRRRLASSDQRLALIASDAGCTRPGCSAPPTRCAVHHVRSWQRGGNTDIDNLTLACDACHALVNDSENGWATVKSRRRTGWVSPRHIDPTRRPRINRRHHPRELIREAASDSDVP
ncbi:DUF222 domain-containing protein [Rhodococcus sp. NPDC058521]|uniref:HNH endonuclease signature motif containing protein n=1 Tax=Rhodococcus sp. NPDC058521 TaxID=3346536 RepID=UPI003652092A